MDQLTDAGEAMLLELVQLTRKRKLQQVNPAAR
jgi:hypothetical protein